MSDAHIHVNKVARQQCMSSHVCESAFSLHVHHSRLLKKYFNVYTLHHSPTRLCDLVPDSDLINFDVENDAFLFFLQNGALNQNLVL